LPTFAKFSQDNLVTEMVRKVVLQNQEFVELEAIEVARRVYLKRGTPSFETTARTRYGSVVVPALAQRISGWSWSSGLAGLLTKGKKSLTPTCEAIEAVRDQINQVNFCPEQVDGILRQEHLRDLYVGQVTTRNDQPYPCRPVSQNPSH